MTRFAVDVPVGPLASSNVKFAELATLPGDAGKLITAGQSSMVSTVPAAATVRLSGGAAGVAATAIAYSS